MVAIHSSTSSNITSWVGRLVHPADDLTDREAGQLAVVGAADPPGHLPEQDALNSGIGSVPVRRRAPTPRSTPYAAGGPAFRSSPATARCRASRRARMFSSASGEVFASATVSQIEPVQAPCAPRASPAAICRPVPMPPAASTGRRPDRIDDLGDNTIEQIVAGVAAGLGALRDDDVDADLDLLLARAACCRPAPRPLTPCSCAVSTTSLGGGPSALTSSLIGCFSATSTAGARSPRSSRAGGGRRSTPPEVAACRTRPGSCRPSPSAPAGSSLQLVPSSFAA